MEDVQYYSIIITLSLILLGTGFLLMFKIHKFMDGRTYRILWWCSFLLLTTLIYSHTMALIAIFQGSQIENILVPNLAVSAAFSLIVICAGYKTTSDLRSTNISKRYMDKIMHSTSSYLVVTDANFRIKKVNNAITQELGVTKNDLKGRHIQSVFGDTDMLTLVGNYNKQVEASIQNKKGNHKSVLLTGEPLCHNSDQIHGYVFQAFDNHQKKIKELYNYFKSIINNAGFAIIATDIEGIVEGVNPVAQSYFYYSESETINKISADTFHHPESMNKLKADYDLDSQGFTPFKQLVDQGKPIDREMVMVRRDGTKFPALIAVNAIKDEDKTIGYLETIVDISEKKRAEDKLRHANKELKDFAHIVSHDLKAPLRAISTLSSWLHDDYYQELGEEGQEQLKLLMSRVSRMESLINGILEYSRIGRVKTERHVENLNHIVEEVRDAVVPSDGFDLIINEPLPSLRVDRTRTQQVFQNIISNAVKYMDKKSGEITISSKWESGFWQFSIADNGPGIEEQYFNKIFKIFQTLKPRDEYESTGIGLAIVKKSVELHGGRVWLNSTLGEGTTFHFTLPEN